MQTKVEGDVTACEQRVLEKMGKMHSDMAAVVEEQQKLNALRGEELRAMLEGTTEVREPREGCKRSSSL